jgi:uncharacterized membrane protein
MTDRQPTFLGAFFGILFFPVSSLGGMAFLASGMALITLSQSLVSTGGRDARVYLLALAGVLIASFLYRILEETVSGSDRAPSLQPDDWGDSWLELVHYLGGVAIAFLPVWILLVYSVFEQKRDLEREDFRILIGVFVLLGTLYLPMALLLNGFTQRFSTAFNFGVGFRAIRKMGADYPFCCLYFLATHAAWVILEMFWVATTPRGFNAARVSAASGTALLGLYLSVLQMRALGKAYRKHQDSLGWSLESEG